MSQYENHHLEDSALPFIYKTGAVRPTNHMFGSSNWHENIEIIHIVEGEGVISDNGHVMPVSKDDVAVINANRLHALAGGKQRMVYRYLIVDRSFCLANGFDSSAVSYDVRIDDRRVRDLMEALNEAYADGTETAYKTLSVRTLVLQLMLVLCREHGKPVAHSDRSEKGAAYIKQAIDYIRAAYDRDFSLEDVAAFVGISKCYLSREFHQYTGYPFVAYVNRMRCKKAQQLLADERLEIHEIAKRCGFENRSYFARSFRRYFGMSPIEYRMNLLKQQGKL